MSTTSFNPLKQDYLTDLEDSDAFLAGPGLQADTPLKATEDWPATVKALLSNRAPRTGEQLRKSNRMVGGLMHTLTLPKEVGLLELSGIDVRAGEAVRRATEPVLRLASMMVSPAGQPLEVHQPAPAAIFGVLQRLTKGRVVTPHRHVHLVALSLAWNEQRQRVTGADLGVLFHLRLLLETYWQHLTAWELRQLGYGIKLTGSAFGIVGFERELVERFCSGKRATGPRPYDRLPTGYFAALQAGWLAQLSAAERHQLEQLRSVGHGGVLHQPQSFVEAMVTEAKSKLAAEFFLPADWVITLALRKTFGHCRVEPELLAEWLAGQVPEHPDLNRFSLRAFALDQRWQWGFPVMLDNERNMLEQLRQLPLENKGWLMPPKEATWWQLQLAADRHRLAVLRADLNAVERVSLRQQLGENCLILDGFRTGNSSSLGIQAAKAALRGTRVLILDAVEPKRNHVWLDHLPAATGIPVLHEFRPLRSAIGRRNGLKVQFRTGTCYEVFAREFFNQRNAYVVVPRRKKFVADDEIQTLRHGDPWDFETPEPLSLRPRFLHTQAEPMVGDLAQYRHNTGGITAGETLEILQVEGSRLKVRRPTGLEAWVQRLPTLEIYEPWLDEVHAGDRIRLTRNHGPLAAGLRSGFTFRVCRLLPDKSTLVLSRGRHLPAGAGHWEFGYCLPVEDGPPRGQIRVVTDDGKLALLQSHGWFRPGVELVICSRMPGAASSRLEKLLDRQPPTVQLAGTLAVGLGIQRRLRKRLVGLEQQVKSLAVPGEVNDSQSVQLPTTPTL